MKTTIIIIASVFLIGGSNVTFAQTSRQATERQIQVANEIVPQMISAGALRVDKAACKAWIEPALWSQSNAEAKGNLAAAIAVYCSEKDPVIELYDAQSAKKLASWGWARGLEVY